MMRERSLIAAMIAHVTRFVSRMNLIPPSGRVIIAVSGGLDSMALLHFAVELRERGIIKQIDVIHINHGTRPENLLEEELVKKVASSHGIHCFIERLTLNGDAADFEQFARRERYRVFESILGPGDLLYTAHHIDDSYEWHLLQKFRSSGESLGIPVINKSIARPLLSLTRRQIERFVDVQKIPFLNDSSNDMLRFDRNYIRKEIIPTISTRFPSYLKQYVIWANQRAFERGEHRNFCGENDILVREDSLGGIVLLSENGSFDGANPLIAKGIKRLSKQGRGVLGQQIDKLIEMSVSGIKGPLLFSGGVYAYSSSGVIYLIHKDKVNNISALDDVLCREITRGQATQIPANGINLRKLRNEMPFPQFVFFRSKRISSLKKEHPLLPKSCKLAMSKGIGFNTFDRFVREITHLGRQMSDENCILVTHSMLQGYLK